MKRMLVVLVLGVACSQAQAETCADIADDAVTVANDVIAEMGDAGVAPTFPPELQQRMDAIEPRADEAGCSDEEFAALMRERADQIEGEGMIAEMMRGAFTEGFDTPTEPTEPFEIPS